MLEPVTITMALYGWIAYILMFIILIYQQNSYMKTYDKYIKSYQEISDEKSKLIWRVLEDTKEVLELNEKLKKEIHELKNNLKEQKDRK